VPTQVRVVLVPFAMSPTLAAGISIDVDATLLVQITLFILLVGILGPLLFAPLFRLFEEREHRTEGARQDAREMQDKAAELLERYQTEVERVQRLASQERERVRVETAALEARILEQSRQAAEKTIEQGRQQIAEQATRVRSDIETSVRSIGLQIAATALGREVS